MAGLYIHIPFCRQKCHYCNFFSLATRKYRDEISEALLLELDIQKAYLKQEKLETIYFGGGTPSLYDPEQIETIIQKAIDVNGILPDAEITVEANPDDISEQWLTKLKKTSVNRLSIGIQSFHAEDLKYLNRVHNSEEAIEVIGKARNHGFDAMSIDLIYGIPTLSNQKWMENIQRVVDMGIPHISAYALTVEPGTALDLFIRKGTYQNVEDEKAEQQFIILLDLLSKAGYKHYEISNFAKPGQYARHNTSYWQGKKYLGIGPSAHSYNRKSRQWNVANIKQYIEGANSGELIFEKEILTKNQQLNEYILTSLRTMWGMDLMKIEKHFGISTRNSIEENLVKAEALGRVTQHNSIVKLTQTGKLFADGIASDLFLEDE